MKPSTFQIKNWERFQHYGKRNPPWIKLYRTLLQDVAFCMLSDVSKAHLILIWLLNSRSDDNCLPYNPQYIAQQIAATEPVDLDALVHAGFLIPDQQVDASNSSPRRLQSATPREERAESRGQRAESVSVPRAKARARAQLPADFALNDVMRGYAHAHGYSPHQINTMFEAFCDHHRAHANTMADWPAAWRTWVRNEGKFNRNVPGRPKHDSPVAAVDRIFDQLGTRDTGDDPGSDQTNLLKLSGR